MPKLSTSSCFAFIATYFLLEAIRKFPDVLFVHASTSSVYGAQAVGNEELKLQPISTYGVTKLAAEQLITCYRDNFKLKTIIFRYFSIYGPNQRPDMAYSIIINSINKGREIKIFGDGNQTRSNTYISDIVAATIMGLFIFQKN